MDTYGPLIGHEHTVTGAWVQFIEIRFVSCRVSFIPFCKISIPIPLNQEKAGNYDIACFRFLFLPPSSDILLRDHRSDLSPSRDFDPCHVELSRALQLFGAYKSATEVKRLDFVSSS